MVRRGRYGIRSQRTAAWCGRHSICTRRNMVRRGRYGIRSQRTAAWCGRHSICTRRNAAGRGINPRHTTRLGRCGPRIPILTRPHAIARLWTAARNIAHIGANVLNSSLALPLLGRIASEITPRIGPGLRVGKLPVQRRIVIRNTTAVTRIVVPSAGRTARMVCSRVIVVIVVHYSDMVMVPITGTEEEAGAYRDARAPKKSGAESRIRVIPRPRPPVDGRISRVPPGSINVRWVVVRYIDDLWIRRLNNNRLALRLNSHILV